VAAGDEERADLLLEELRSGRVGGSAGRGADGAKKREDREPVDRLHGAVAFVSRSFQKARAASKWVITSARWAGSSNLIRPTRSSSQSAKYRTALRLIRSG